MDAQASSPGEGSRAHPLRSLGEALARGAGGPPFTVRLSSGLYPGPFELPGGVRLVGAGAVVLHAEGPAVLHAPRGAILEGLMVQGAAVGLVANGAVELRAVKFSGQRDTAVRVEGGALMARDCEFAATLSGIRGVGAGRGAAATLRDCAFLGPFRRAVEAAEAEVSVAGSVFEGPGTGVHQLGGAVRVEASHFSGGRGPALFGAGGALTLRGVSVFGHEYGLQTGAGALLDVEDFTSVRAERAGLALVKTRGLLAGVLVVDSGSYGGLQLLESDLRIERLRVHAALPTGLVARLGRLSLSDALFTGVRAEREPSGSESGGDAVVVRGAEARFRGLTVAGAAGAGVVATAHARVGLFSATLEDCRFGGVAADQGARVDAVSLLVRRAGSAAVIAFGGAEVRVDLLRAERGPAGPSVEFAEGAKVILTR